MHLSSTNLTGLDKTVSLSRVTALLQSPQLLLKPNPETTRHLTALLSNIYDPNIQEAS
jgi:hypothetical protein